MPALTFNNVGEIVDDDCAHCLPDTCNTTTGMCTGCKPGYLGMRCDIMCPAGTFSSYCQRRCPESCDMGAECHHVTGTCLYGCIQGFVGSFCNETCSIGFYGKNCAETCSEYCYDHNCFPHTGECISCGFGRSGSFCEESSASVDDMPAEFVVTSIMGIFALGISMWAYIACVIFLKNALVRREARLSGTTPPRWVRRKSNFRGMMANLPSKPKKKPRRKKTDEDIKLLTTLSRLGSRATLTSQLSDLNQIFIAGDVDPPNFKYKTRDFANKPRFAHRVVRSSPTAESASQEVKAGSHRTSVISEICPALSSAILTSSSESDVESGFHFSDTDIDISLTSELNDRKANTKTLQRVQNMNADIELHSSLASGSTRTITVEGKDCVMENVFDLTDNNIESEPGSESTFSRTWTHVPRWPHQTKPIYVSSKHGFVSNSFGPDAPMRDLKPTKRMQAHYGDAHQPFDETPNFMDDAQFFNESFENLKGSSDNFESVTNGRYYERSNVRGYSTKTSFAKNFDNTSTSENIVQHRLSDSFSVNTKRQWCSLSQSDGQLSPRLQRMSLKGLDTTDTDFSLDGAFNRYQNTRPRSNKRKGIGYPNAKRLRVKERPRAFEQNSYVRNEGGLGPSKSPSLLSQSRESPLPYNGKLNNGQTQHQDPSSITVDMDELTPSFLSSSNTENAESPVSFPPHHHHDYYRHQQQGLAGQETASYNSDTIVSDTSVVGNDTEKGTTIQSSYRDSDLTSGVTTASTLDEVSTSSVDELTGGSADSSSSSSGTALSESRTLSETSFTSSYVTESLAKSDARSAAQIIPEQKQDKDMKTITLMTEKTRSEEGDGNRNEDTSGSKKMGVDKGTDTVPVRRVVKKSKYVTWELPSLRNSIGDTISALSAEDIMKGKDKEKELTNKGEATKTSVEGEGVENGSSSKEGETGTTGRYFSGTFLLSRFALWEKRGQGDDLDATDDVERDEARVATGQSKSTLV